MKLNIDRNRDQADPFIFADGGKLYLYVTGCNGVEAYTADDLFGRWNYQGIVAYIEGGANFWAPSVIKIDEKYYMYVSCDRNGNFEHMFVLSAYTPLGKFEGEKEIYDRFSIDSHMIQTEKGLFMYLSMDNTDTDRVGTRIFIDRFIDPYTPENKPKEMIVPTLDEEIFQRNRFGDGKDWHTIEGAFWFEKDGWQYVMYSGACFENDTYHLGYASCRYEDADLTKAKLIKHTDNGKFAPILIKNDIEEGTGHNSVICYKGEYYCIYHGRDINGEYAGRTARIRKMKAENGKIEIMNDEL